MDSPLTALALLFSATLLLLSGCTDQESSTGTSPQSAEVQTSPQPKKMQSTRVSEHFLAQAQVAFEQAALAAEKLKSDSQAYIKTASEDTLAATRTSWRQAHQAFYQTYLFSTLPFYHPELDIDQSEPLRHSLMVRVDQTPLLGGYLDSIEGYPRSGLTHNEAPLSLEYLNSEHQYSDKEYVTLGFHAIEFLLWNKPPEVSSVPEGYSSTNTDPQASERRRKLLELTTTALVQDLKRWHEAWRRNDSFYSISLLQQQAPDQTEIIRETLMTVIQTEIIKPAESTTRPAHSSLSDNTASDQVALLDRLLKVLDNKDLSIEFADEKTAETWLKKIKQLQENLKKVSSPKEPEEQLRQRVELAKRTLDLLRRP